MQASVNMFGTVVDSTLSSVDGASCCLTRKKNICEIIIRLNFYTLCTTYKIFFLTFLKYYIVWKHLGKINHNLENV